MRVFAQSLVGEARKWFTGLQNTTIADFPTFETLFKNKWEDKKNPRHYLSHYHSMRRKESDPIQEFLDRFMKVYNAIPA